MASPVEHRDSILPNSSGAPQKENNNILLSIILSIANIGLAIFKASAKVNVATNINACSKVIPVTDAKAEPEGETVVVDGVSVYIPPPPQWYNYLYRSSPPPTFDPPPPPGPAEILIDEHPLSAADLQSYEDMVKPDYGEIKPLCAIQ